MFLNNIIIKSIQFNRCAIRCTQVYKQIKTAPKTDEKTKESKVPKSPRKERSKKKSTNDIHHYYDTTEMKKILSLFPEKLIKKKLKAPDLYYVAEPSTAKTISNILLTNLDDTTIVEMNAGPGILTKELLKNNISNNLILYENNIEAFASELEIIHKEYPKQVALKNGDLIAMWKLAFQDKLDQGNRISELLYGIPHKPWNEGYNARFFGCVGSINFIKYLINSIIFQTGITTYGRYEMFLAMPPPLYIHLTCTRDIGYLLYRASTILFQILFEYEYITKLPRESFLPWQYEYDLSPKHKLTRVNSINPEFLYLVRLTPRKNLYSLIVPEYLPALWYFVKQHFISRKNRIIPTLEKWIPDSGPRLILNSTEAMPVTKLESIYSQESLPQYSVPATTMSVRDFYEKINIFTEFGDLTPSQILTLFDQFRKWPEYRQCPFLPSLESNLLKMETSADEHVDSIEIHEEDDQNIEEIK